MTHRLLLRLVQLLAVVLVGQTVVVTLVSWADYFPPDFRAPFLIGRDGYFFGPYQWAFYAHVVAGPACLLAGLVLLSGWVRQRWPGVHRGLGRLQVGTILVVLTPSGLWMAPYAEGGVVAVVGFATLAVATAACALLGWRSALVRRWEEHRWWMLRTYMLLVSAVVLRAIGGASEVWGLEGTYPYAAWLSWLLPLAGLELLRFQRLREVFHAP